MSRKRVSRHIVIPDTQVKPGVRIDHLERVGKFIADKKPDVVIHLGDHWDMPSLSSYDKGKKSYEGRRYAADIRAGNKALGLLEQPILDEIERTGWNPTLILLRGNHEERIQRAVEADPILEDTIGYHDFADDNWNTFDFLDVAWIDGIAYSHYFANPMSGRPYGGQSIDTRLKSIGHSFTMGHQQQLMMGCRPTLGGIHYGLVAGNCYQHDESYRVQANKEWRGIIMKNEVHDGEYDINTVSLDYLARKYPSKAIYA